MPGDPHRSDRVGRSLGPRVSLGFVLGAVVGIAIGLGAGLVVFEAGSRAMWGSIVAGAVFGGLIGAFWGGMGSLGPPAAADDPLPRTGEDRSEIV